MHIDRGGSDHFFLAQFLIKIMNVDLIGEYAFFAFNVQMGWNDLDFILLCEMIGKVATEIGNDFIMIHGYFLSLSDRMESDFV